MLIKVKLKDYLTINDTKINIIEIDDDYEYIDLYDDENNKEYDTPLEIPVRYIYKSK